MSSGDGPVGLIEHAKSKVDDPNPRLAYPSLRAALSYPASKDLSPELFKEGLEILAKITARIASQDTASIAARAASLPTNGVALFVFGVSMLDQEQYGIAATLLTRAVDSDPKHEGFRGKAVSALERNENFNDALKYLNEGPESPAEPLLNMYQKAWLSARVGDLTVAREVNDRLQEGCRQIQEEPYLTVARRIDTLIQRDANVRGLCPLDEKDLRGWHYILNGGILLHRSPHGDEVMNGRYAYVKDSESLCKEAVTKICAVLRHQNVTIPKVFVLSEPRSQIIALALGAALGCQLTAWPDGGTNEPGIVPVYDLEILSDTVFSSLSRDAPGQFLWAHTIRWTDHTPRVFAADFVTFLHQTCNSPWEGGIGSAPGDAIDLRVADLEALAVEITNAEPDPAHHDDEQEVVALARAIGFGQQDAPGRVRRRDMQWPGSPVRSNRF